uniref:Uncharacterized protein n=1 Tax=Setaria italica TaxID=4555 RepID=K3ZYT6_SETIT
MEGRVVPITASSSSRTPALAAAARVDAGAWQNDLRVLLGVMGAALCSGARLRQRANTHFLPLLACVF